MKELHFIEREEGTSSYDVVLVMSSDRISRADTIRIICSDVSDFYLKSFGGGLTQITGLFIKDIHENGWERMKWEIGDFENGVIKFFAAAVSVS